jgi:hypothetical protein
MADRNSVAIEDQEVSVQTRVDEMAWTPMFLFPIMVLDERHPPLYLNEETHA